MQLEPFDATEYELESIGVTSGMTVEEAIDKLVWLGPPLRVEERDLIRDYDYTVYYDNYSILYRGCASSASSKGYEIFKPGIAGIRGLEVGGSVEKVLNSFLITNVTPGIWENHEKGPWWHGENRLL